MSTSCKIIVKEQTRNESIRTTTIEAGSKLIQTPCYCTKIRSPKELNIFCEKPQQYDNIQGIFYDVYNVDEIIKLREANQYRKTLLGAIEPDTNYLFVKGSFAIFIDPCTEYFYFQSPKREKYLKIKSQPPLPQYIKDLLRSTDKTHLHNWIKVRDDGNIPNLINWYIRHSSTNFADVIIPPTPLLDGSSNDLLEIAFEINKNTALLTTDKKACAIYFPLNFKIFRNISSHLERIIQFLWDNETILKDANIIFVKIKNYDFNTNGVSRQKLKNFLFSLSQSAKSLGKAVFLLDTDSLGLISLFCGVDGYIEPMDANIKDQRGEPSALSYMGKYYNPQKLDFWKYEDLLDYFKNKGTLPCNCPVCAAINKSSSLPKDKDDWNIKRKVHFLHSRNSEMKEVHHSIKNNYTRGIADKIIQSNYKNYLDLIPNGI